MLSVKGRLLQFLKEEPAVGGIKLQGTLEAQEPLQIDDKSNVGQLHSFKEHWRWENCKMSLERNGVYEAPGSLFWFSMRKPTWNGAELPATDLTYGQLAAGRQVWSDSKFFRSSEDPEKRNYFIQGSTPSAVSSLADIPAEKAVGFVSLPCLGARGMIAGWYSTVDDALRDREKRKILKLYEAALSMPMRLRLGPSRVYVSMDSISYSEDFFAAKKVVSYYFFEFAQKLIDVFPFERPDWKTSERTRRKWEYGICFVLGAPGPKQIGKSVTTT